MSEIMSKVGFGSSDYGGSFVDFEKSFLRSVTPKTTVIVLGDARTNNLDPRADILRTHFRALEAAGLAQPRGSDGLGLGRFRNAALCRLLHRGAPVRDGKAARAGGVGYRGGVSVIAVTWQG